MDGLKQLIGLAPARSSFPPVETDDVYPVHMLDDTKTLRDIVIAWTLRFNDVLDAEKLHGSLSRLLEIGDWRKAGGRLRLKVGSLLLHLLMVAYLRILGLGGRRTGDLCPKAIQYRTPCGDLHSPALSYEH